MSNLVYFMKDNLEKPLWLNRLFLQLSVTVMVGYLLFMVRDVVKDNQIDFLVDYAFFCLQMHLSIKFYPEYREATIRSMIRQKFQHDPAQKSVELEPLTSQTAIGVYSNDL